jgi:hypothetical protein
MKVIIRRIVRVLISTLVLASLLASCGIRIVNGSGTLTTQSRPVSEFTEVELLGDGELSIEQTGSESLSIEAEDTILPMLRSRIANGRLILDTQEHTIIR